MFKVKNKDTTTESITNTLIINPAQHKKLVDAYLI